MQPAALPAGAVLPDPVTQSMPGALLSEALSPVEAAIRAIEDARLRVAEAVAAVASGDEAQLSRAYELTAECTDPIARALWFLRRAEHAGAPEAREAAR